MAAVKKTLVIADDHPLIAEGIAGFLSSEYEVLGIASNGRQLVVDVTRLRPDLVVLDISMPVLNGIEAARQIIQLVPATKLVFVTQQMELDYLRAAFHAGARGYVSKQCASDELKTALKRVVAGGTYVSPLLEGRAAFAPVSELQKQGGAPFGELTTRQREVLQMVAEGKTSRQIGSLLSISAKTVEFHKKALMDQTGLRTTAELTRYAITAGMVTL